MPGLKPKAEGKPAQPQKPRKRRPHGFARTRMTPTQRVEQVVEQCPDCGTQLSGGWTQRTREVIDLPRVPVEVAEHVYIARTCPQCQRCCTPTAQLGVNLVSLIAALREEARLPFRTSQWYLDTVHGLRLSLGAIVDATQRVARKAQAVMADIVERIRGSPVVHADETGWLAGGRTQRPCVDFQHSYPAVLPATGPGQDGGGRSPGRGVCWRAGQRLLRRLPSLRRPQATLLGPPVAGRPRPARTLSR